MNPADVILIRNRVVVDGSGTAVAFTRGLTPSVRVHDPEGEAMLRVEKRFLDEWYARAPDDWTILRIDRSLNKFHDVTYADGRTARFNAAPEAGAWELTGSDGRLLIHARAAGHPLGPLYQWMCSQDGSLSLLDFLATVITYRELRLARRQHAQAVGNLS